MPRYRGTTFFQVCLGRLADVGVESGLDGKWRFFGDSTRLPGPCFPLNNDSGSGKLPFKYVVTRKSLWNNKARWVFFCNFGWFVECKTGKKPCIQSKNVRAPLTNKNGYFPTFLDTSGRVLVKKESNNNKWNKFKPGFLFTLADVRFNYIC